MSGSIQHQHGLSLVELLVGVALGIVLVAGVLQIFDGTKRGYRFAETQSRVQENARFGLDILGYDMRMAGSVGCSAYAENFNNRLVAANLPAPFNPEAGIEGWEATGTAPGSAAFNLPAANAALVDAGISATWTSSGGSQLDLGTMTLPGSDIIRVWRADPVTAAINDIDTSGAAPIVNVTGNIDIQPGEILLMTDCQNVDLVQACTVAAGAPDANGNPTTILTLSGACTPGNAAAAPILTQVGGQLLRLESFIYYVSKRDGIATNPPGLFRSPLGAGVANSAAAGVAEEVVEGVENLQVVYGVDLNGNRVIDQYRTADNVPDWNDVLSMQIALLMRSTETGDDVSGAVTRTLLRAPDAGGNLQNIQANVPADGRFRQIYTTTITLRNRVQ